MIEDSEANGVARTALACLVAVSVLGASANAASPSGQDVIPASPRIKDVQDGLPSSGIPVHPPDNNRGERPDLPGQTMVPPLPTPWSAIVVEEATPSKPKPKPKPAAVKYPTTKPPNTKTSHSLGGRATWHATGRNGRYGAAGPLLRKALGKNWRGKRVWVCTSRCIRVTLNDWCLCSKGRRLVDLSDEAFRSLAPLSRGVLRVTVRW